MFDPATGTISIIPGLMSVGRYGPTATLLPSGKVLIAEGRSYARYRTDYMLHQAADLLRPAQGSRCECKKEHIAADRHQGSYRHSWF